MVAQSRSLFSVGMAGAVQPCILLRLAEVCLVLGTILTAQLRTTVFSAKAVVRTQLQHRNSLI